MVAVGTQVQDWGFLQGGGEAGACMRAVDWSRTPLGEPAGWPQSLRTAVRIMLDSRHAMWMAWGDGLPFLYNDAYAPTLGAKHPRAMGLPTREVWAEVWDFIQSRLPTVMAGEATWDEGLLLFLERNGFPEETYHSFSYSPLRDDAGAVRGLLCVVTEETERHVAVRHTAVLRELAVRLGGARTVEAVAATAAQALSTDPLDLPYLALYRVDADAGLARRTAVGRIDGTHRAVPPVVRLDDASGWPIGQCVRECGLVEVPDLAARLGVQPAGDWQRAPRQGVVVPLDMGDDGAPTAVLVAALSPHRMFDAAYRGFIELAARQIGGAMGIARRYEDAQRRAEALAELDRAKTAFFGNVSHEFRTPLTLMLGPLQDLQDDGAVPPELAATVDLVHRNALRLQRLVNTLLEFSRVEAGRAHAHLQPTDLARLTADLASTFRSACERAGLALDVDCPPLPRPALVDHGMWETIVLNLLSNAFKHTLRGRIGVRVQAVGDRVQVQVSDTGTGIPAADVPHLFDRFHRVAGAGGRSHEGSGIGLALVQELVRLHDGTIDVDTTPGAGSTFTITLPLADAAALPAALPPRHAGAQAYVAEALRWLPAGAAADASPAGTADDARPRVLVADDNADLREYLGGLLRSHYRVQVVGDGETALEAARGDPPALVISDVMMPGLDGFGLLAALRANPATQGVPVILLSARAGEEARIEGLQAGADDYVTKPFNARELLARVAAVIATTAVRREALEREVTLERERIDVLETIGDAFIALDADWTIRYVNASLERTVDGSRVRIVGQSHWDVFPADAVDLPYAELLRMTMRTRRPQRVEHYYAPLDKWFEVDMMPASDGGLHIYGRDITARRQRFDALRDSERLLRETADQAPAMLWITDPDGLCTFLSRAWYAYTGQTVAEGLGMGWLDAVHPDYREAAGDAFRRANARQEPFTLEHPLRTASGEYRWVIDAGQPRLDAEGRFAGYIGSVMDVHESRAAREVLEQTEARLRAATAAASVGTWRVDLRTGLDTRDAGLNGFLGLPAVDTTQPLQDFMERVHPDDRARVQACVQEAIASRSPYDLECRVVREDGDVRWLRGRGGVVVDAGGEVVALTGAATDVTAQREVDAALAESEARYRTLFETMDEGFCIIEMRYDDAGVGVDYRFLETNPSFISHVGLHDAVGRWVREMVPDLEPDWARRYGEVARNRQPVRFEARSDALGSNFEVNAFPIGRPEQHRVAVLFNDITQRTRDEEALRDADRRKDEFLATLAHELRNPLAPISSALQLLAGDVDARLAEHLHAIMRRQTRQLTRLVDDLMEVSRITRGRIDLQVEPTDVRDTVRDALDASAEAIRAGGHSVQVDLPDEPLVMQADTVRLSQVFTNLLNNAARHTDPGGQVRVRAWRCDDSICVSVADTGHGISPCDRARIFELFAQVAPAGASKGGLGIGLTLARRLVEMHGGIIDVESEGAGRGSTFTVRLPSVTSRPVEPATDAAPAAPQDDAGPLSGLRVVVADDNHDAAATLAMWLEMQGAQATQAHDGVEALDAITRTDAHAALLDLGMPRGGGIEVARQLRKRDDVRRALLVAVTGWGQAIDRERTREAGFDHHMTKPADLDTLHALLAPVAARARAGAQAHEGGPGTT